MSKHTPGPWRWDVHPKQHTVQLCGGRPQYDLTVMTCERWGMAGAAPSFLRPADGSSMLLITRADAFMAPIPGREHHADWLQTIDHPDAHLIAAAPELLEACRAVIWWQERTGGMDDRLDQRDVYQPLLAAIAKAEGR